MLLLLQQLLRRYTEQLTLITFACTGWAKLKYPSSKFAIFFS